MEGWKDVSVKMRKKFCVTMVMAVLAILPALFMAAGHAGEDAYAAADPSSNRPPTIVSVSTAEELVSAIGSNTTILLSDGVYHLSELNQGAFSTGDKAWREVGDGKELWIMNVHNLTLKGESPDCRIVVSPRDAEVLTFLNCTGITIENITAGHTLQPGACDSGVFYFEDCADIRINNTHMYGCGSYGLEFNRVSDASVENSSVYECIAQLITLTSSRRISFVDCTFRDAELYAGMIMEDVENATIDHCQFTHIRTVYPDGSLFDVTDSSGIVVKNSSFTDNTAGDIDPSRLIRFENSAFTGNAFGEYSGP